jgi:hypothetical protein
MVSVLGASVLALAVSASAQGISAEDYDRRNFDRPTTIDNEYLPLRPGAKFVYEGTVREGKGRIPVGVVSIVTDLTKVIDGVRSVVIYEEDYVKGKLLESEIAFHAQDNDGNVWHLGQLRETYDEEGEFVGGRAWMVGHLEGAKAGIRMPAQPRLGTPAFSEGFAPPPFFWDDFARVFRTGVKTCVPYGCFEDVLVTDEFEPSKPRAHQLKYHARGVGVVRVGWRGRNETQREILKLVEVVQLGPEELAAARAVARELETRAYVYATTLPAEGPLGADGP